MPFTPGHTIAVERRWKPGQSGNPRGRSKLDIGLAEAARAHTAEMLQIAVDIARDESVPPESRLRAVEIVLSRGHGKPIAPHVIEASVGNVDLTQAYLEVLRAYAQAPAIEGGTKPLLPANLP